MTFGFGLGLTRGGGAAGLPAFAANLVSGSLPNGVTFTRNSTAQYYNSSGLLTSAAINVPRFDYDPNPATYVQQNMLRYSQDLTNGAWGKALGATVAASPNPAPDGTFTAQTVFFTATASNRVEQATTVYGLAVRGETVTFSVWLRGSGTIDISVDTDTGVGGISEITVTLSSAWQRFSTTVTYASPTGYRRGMVVWRGGTTATQCDVWGAQINNGASPLSYLATTSSPLTICSPKGLLVEEARTNQITNSQDFTLASSIGVTVTASATTSPDGTVNGQKVAETAVTSAHEIDPASSATVVSTVYTISIYAKAAERSFLWIGPTTLVQGVAWFNLSNGTVGTKQLSVLSSSIQNVGNGWYKCSMSFTATATTHSPRFGLATADAVSSYLGVAGNGLYMYGAQMEAGSFATSLIPTSGAAATKNADVANLPTGPWYSTTQGTFVTQFDIFSTSQPSPRIIGGNVGSKTPLAVVTGVVSYDGTQIPGTGQIVPAINTATKAGSIFNGTALSVCVSGGTVQSGTGTAGYGDLTQLGFGYDPTTSGSFLNGHVLSFQYYNYAMTNAQLQAATT